MKRILKQSVGIDVTQKELVVQLGRLFEDLSTELYAHKCFPNALEQWVLKLMEPQHPLCNGGYGSLSSIVGLLLGGSWV